MDYFWEKDLRGKEPVFMTSCQRHILSLLKLTLIAWRRSCLSALSSVKLPTFPPFPYHPLCKEVTKLSPHFRDGGVECALHVELEKKGQWSRKLSNLRKWDWGWIHAEREGMTKRCESRQNWVGRWRRGCNQGWWQVSRHHWLGDWVWQALL